MKINNGGSKENIVQDNMDNIKKWLLEGATVKSVAKTLGISKTTLYKHLGSGGLDFIKDARKPSVEKLENTMFQSATGYTKKVKKYQKVKRCVYENGKKAEEWEEMFEYEEEIYYPPDTTAGIFLLKNWGKYMNEPQALEIRKKELELKEKQVEANSW